MDSDTQSDVSQSSNDQSSCSNSSLNDVDIKFDRSIVNIEICVNPKSKLKDDEIKKLFRSYSSINIQRYKSGKLQLSSLPNNIISHINYINICLGCNIESVSSHNSYKILHVFRNNQDGMIEEIDDENDDINSVNVANSWNLPNKQFDGLFDTLIYDDDIKDRLLNYMNTVSIYGNNNINSNLISWNGIILLHGPPGTGKTSLCQALAQKLSIRLYNKYKYITLIEINSHSLFSKWFSESGKLIQRLFKHIIELIEDNESLIFILIDEVESLASARKAALNGNEPTDSIRAVNALLTQIDHLKNYQNVLILTTSNISQSIDLAFIDRADLKQYIGFPGDKAKYFILKSCLNELIHKNVLIVKNNSNNNSDNNIDFLLEYEKIKGIEFKNNNINNDDDEDDDMFHNDLHNSPIPFTKIKKRKRYSLSLSSNQNNNSPFRKQIANIDINNNNNNIQIGYHVKCSQLLLNIVKSMDQFSGRTLRKLPFMTSVHYVQTSTYPLYEFLKALRNMVTIEKEQRLKLHSTSI